ncbi:MAG TPA: hypothetical protein VGV13_01630 [Methylomirabilota bacterium]|jgi:hypothetical protein|nr:hypothetical protein [Methylomirabilota bacterium]
MQVAAFSSSAGPAWRWRIVDDEGEVIEESAETFPTIVRAVAQGTQRLVQMRVVDRSLVIPAIARSRWRGRA